MSPAAAACTLLLLADESTAACLAPGIAKAAPDLDLYHVIDQHQIGAHPVPKVMVIDLDMELERAFELLSWTRSQPLYREIPVIGITGLGPSYADRAYALGVNCCLEKPAEPSQMDGIAEGIGTYASLLAQRA